MNDRQYQHGVHYIIAIPNTVTISIADIVRILEFGFDKPAEASSILDFKIHLQDFLAGERVYSDFCKSDTIFYRLTVLLSDYIIDEVSTESTGSIIVPINRHDKSFKSAKEITCKLPSQIQT